MVFVICVVWCFRRVDWCCLCLPQLQTDRVQKQVEWQLSTTIVLHTQCRKYQIIYICKTIVCQLTIVLHYHHYACDIELFFYSLFFYFEMEYWHAIFSFDGRCKKDYKYAKKLISEKTVVSIILCQALDII